MQPWIKQVDSYGERQAQRLAWIAEAGQRQRERLALAWIAAANLDELRAFRRGDELTHWHDHPEAIRWRARAAYWDRPYDQWTGDERRLQGERNLASRRNDPDYREKRNAWRRQRVQSDNQFRIRETLQSTLSQALKAGRKSPKLEALIGCSISALRNHLSAQFTGAMTWANYGKVWQVDHIKPRAAFDHTDPRQRAICWHYTNLRPLLCEDNRMSFGFHRRLAALRKSLRTQASP